MKKISILIFIGFIVIANVIGIWFLMGGNLEGLINGCFNAKGC